MSQAIKFAQVIYYFFSSSFALSFLKPRHAKINSSSPGGHVHPQQLAPLIPVDGLDKRIECSKSLEAYIRSSCVTHDFRLRTEHIVALMAVSLRKSSQGPTVTADANNQQSIACPSTVSDHNNDVQTEENTSTDYDSDSNTSSSIKRIEKHYLDDAERAKCLQRDGNVCVVTGAPEPGVYHIAPFTWNDTQAHIRKTRKLASGRGLIHEGDFLTRAVYLDDPNHQGSSDKTWNMICLDPQLYSWWANGYCAFKCLGVESAGSDEVNVTLEFRWMPQTKTRFGQNGSLQYWHKQKP
ncbi:hypothetical protein FZEAL_2679 [Fusarium zealandicum]|uniref:HNH nuclease domain-containing protein n=1 Tax=Fusarium zealandicum TaxID=1053134 RepID=A0A8H4UQY6_9HYPO|nr:hypothetical protein FZEAL_2679 [Fusarium zealandicum]